MTEANGGIVSTSNSHCRISRLNHAVACLYNAPPAHTYAPAMRLMTNDA
jgi:hypothetical protein